MKNFKFFASALSSVKSANGWIDGKLRNVPFPWLVKRIAAFAILVIVTLLLVNLLGMGLGLMEKPFSLLGLTQLVIGLSLALGVFAPKTLSAIILARREVPVKVSWMAQGVSFLLLAVWNELSPIIGATAFVLLLIAVIGYVLTFRRIGEWIKKVIPGTWEEPIVDRFEKGTRVWSFWAIPTLLVFLGFGEFLTTNVYTFKVRDFDQQTDSEAYKVYTDLYASSELDGGWTFVNVRDIRFFKLDTAGVQGSLTANKDREVHVLANGIHWPSRDIFPNIVTLLPEGSGGWEYRLYPISFLLTGVLWAGVGGFLQFRERKKKKAESS